MRKCVCLYCLFALLVPACAAMAAGPFEGKFSDGKLTVQWTESGDDCSGTISLGEQQFQSTGHASRQAVDGTFVSGANQFSFKGTLDGDTLTFVTGGKTYLLQRQSDAVNPLAGGNAAPAADPLAANSLPAAVEGVPAEFKVIKSTDAGKALSAQKPVFPSVSAALQATLPDLAKYFDERPSIVRAYQDTQDPNSGGVSFKAILKGQPVNGLLSCKLSDKGSAIAVLYCKAGATAADWAQLTAPAAGGTAGAASIPLHSYQFPDGTGTIGLADGWTTNAPTCHGMFIVTGPADQVITMQLTVTAVTPNSTAVQMNRQLNANAQRLGGRPIPLGLYVVPYDGPVNVLKNLAPQISAQIQQKGGAGFTLDHLKQIKEIKPMLPNGKAAFANYGITVTENGQKKHRFVLAQMEVDPVSNDSFMFGLSSAAAPDATFKADLPTMLAIMNSLQENAAVFAQQTHEQIQAMNQRFAAQQKAQQEVQSAYDDYNKDMERNSIIRSRSNDDFDEVIRGYRTVEDTSTGDKTSVDLGNVDQVVNNLNACDPGRYKEIPLRDEADPLPPAGQ